MKKTQMEAILSNVPGEFKELFIENSKITAFNIVNGKLKSPVVKTLKGTSLLVREKNEEYFSVISGKNEGLESEISKFIEGNSFETPAFKVSLNGEDEYNISSLTSIKSPEKIVEQILSVFEEEMVNVSFLKSSSISLNLSEKAFIVGNSDGNFASDSLFYNTFFVNLIGERDGSTEEIFKKITGVDIIESFEKEKFRETIKLAIETLDNQLGAEPSPSGEMEVIIGNESGGTIIHEAVGHGLEADLQSTSAYAGKIGEKVASDCVTVVDDPNISKMRGFYSVDHEGNTPKKTVLIEKGVLKSYMHTSKTARKFGVESTGHARRENYKYTTLVRMGTTYLAPGTDTREDLISRVKSGIFVSEMGGGQVDTTTGDFVFKVQSGYKIENGKLTSRIRGATLSGNGPEMLKNIYGVCNDLDFFDGGTCGKGQSMPVSDGTATVLTKLKVSGLQ